jgi:hypothetical protein
MHKFVSLGLALLSFYQLPQSGLRMAHSARLGDVQVTVIAARIASDQDIQNYGLHPRTGYNVALVFLRVKNVAQYPSCSNLDEWLHVKQGYEYPESGAFKLSAPKTNNVLPTEESSGAFVFEIKAGMEPSSLKLVRSVIAESMCATFQHRNTSLTGPESVSLSLLGLPANTGPAVTPIQSPAKQVPTPTVTQQKFEIQEQQSNVIPMKDGFEYRVVDYGVGRIQVRNQGAKTAPVPETKPRFGPILPKPKELGDFTEQVFWVKFQITNTAENLIGNARYFPSVLNALRVTDNWGNVYSLRYPDFTDVGGNWFGAVIPGGSEGKEQYKPNESSWAVRLIRVDQFVAQVKELRIDLANQFEYPKFYFKLEEPLSRQRDLLRSQIDPDPNELGIKVVSEAKPPAGK